MRWLHKFRRPAVLVVSSFSLLAAAAFAAGGPYGDLDSALRNDQGAARLRSDLERARPTWIHDSQMREAVQFLAGSDDAKDRKRAEDEVRQLVALRAAGERVDGGVAKTAAATAHTIKTSPLYGDPGVQESSNWLRGALERLSNLHWNPPKAPSARPPSLAGAWLTYTMWFLLGALVLLFVFLALMHVDWKTRLRRRAKTLLEDDEPERTLDEWLQIADRMAAEGRHREAVRALYLACLLKFDEARVARFDRGQTNWEHLARIESSPRFPAGLDFRAPTKEFDRIWYGYQVRGIEDVDRFRVWYTGVTQAVAGVEA